MRLVVFGPTGATGRSLIDQALAAGHEVTAFTRSEIPDRPPPLRVFWGNVFDADEVTAAVRGTDAIASCLGSRPWRHTDVCSEGIRSILAAMRDTGVRRVIAMSSQGVGNARFSVLGSIAALAIRREIADKKRMEDLLAESDVDWTVVRPGILTNSAPRGRWRVADDGSIVGGTIPRADVAAFMLHELRAGEWRRRSPTLVAERPRMRRTREERAQTGA